MKVKEVNVIFKFVKILSLYLESRDNNPPATKELFAEIKKGKYQAVISDLVLQEIKETANPLKKKTLMEAVQRFQVIKISAQAKVLTQKYLKEKILPKSARLDALHLAVATVGEVDLVVSWNLKHLVKVKTKLGVNGVNMQAGFKTIDIVTPWEVIENGL